MFGPRCVDAQRHHDTVPADLDPIDQQHRQVQRVERCRAPRVQLRLGLRHKASTDRTLAGAPRRDVRAQRFETPRILAGRHADEHLVDDAPVQRVRVRERLGRGQRHLHAVAPHSGPTDRDFMPAQDDLARSMAGAIRVPGRLMRIPGATHGSPIFFEHRLEHP